MLASCLNEMNGFTMKHAEKDRMFQICCKIVGQLGEMNKEMLQQDTGMSPSTVVEATTNFFSTEIGAYKTRYIREKQLSNDEFYVEPQQKSVGTRIELVYDKITQVEKQRRIQSTLQIVSIISTLKAFFSRPENVNLYFKYQLEHQCQDGVYQNFCCGQVYKSEDFFQSNPNAMQLQLAIDDLEICDPLGSKSNLHKISAVYLVIRNLPHRFNSKLNNIFLVCLCNADDIKTKNTDINNIWEIIVDEIKYLEQTGIVLSNGEILKGTLVSIAADNLGANVALCLSESFRSFFYCRICKLHRDECQNAYQDSMNQYRNNSHYEQMLNIVRDSEEVNLKETCGIKRYCVLNDLMYFDIFKNFSLDIMHDLNEGVVSFLLIQVTSYLQKNKVVKEEDIKNMVKFHQYPKHFRRDKPSILNFKRNNLGQNASQMKCLFLNFPFILMKYEKNAILMKVWPCVIALLKNFQIVYSEVIDEVMLKELKECVSLHLKLLKELFDAKLIPKHHFMTHYENIIRMVGPLLHMSMIRFDAKHTHLKKIVRNTNNFRNINKTIAFKHQQWLASSENSFCDKITHSKEKLINIDFIKKNFNEHILSHIRNSTDSFEINSLSFNAYKYERHSVVSYQNKLFEIEMVLLTDSQYFFVAFELQFLGVHEFSQSLEVKKVNPLQYSLIKYTDISHKKPYCFKFVGERQFVIIDNRCILKTL